MSDSVLKLKSSVQGDFAVVEAAGKIDAQTSAQLNDAIKANIGAGKAKVILDMKQVSYISSAGIGVLVANLKEAKGAGGGIRLVGVQKTVRDVFDLLRFTMLFPMVDSLPDAMKDF